MYAACSAQSTQLEGKAYYPQSYRNVADVFHVMNGASGIDFHSSCTQSIRSNVYVLETHHQLEEMLTTVLKVMIGMQNKDFNPLRNAASKEECLKNGEAKHCLVFVFTLFCNLGVMNFNAESLQIYRFMNVLSLVKILL